MVANGEMEMNAQATKLHAAENDLKQLMADVARGGEKGQGGGGEKTPKARDRHNRDGIYDFIALERQALAGVHLVLFAGRREDILRSRVRAKRRLINVRFTPKAPEVVHCGELTGCANSGLMHCSKNHSSTCVCNANITMVEASRSPP